MNRCMVVSGELRWVSDGELETFIDRSLELGERARLLMDAPAMAYHMDEAAYLMSLRAENLYEMAA